MDETQAAHSEAPERSRLTERTMNRLLMRYLERLPGAMHENGTPGRLETAPMRLLAALAPPHVADDDLLVSTLTRPAWTGAPACVPSLGDALLRADTVVG